MTPFDFEKERQSIDLSVAQIDHILEPLGLRCVEKCWLKNPAGQWFVNKVFKLSCAPTDACTSSTCLALKVMHPWWIGQGKTLSEVRCLRLAASKGVPVPKVISFHVGACACPFPNDITKRGEWLTTQKKGSGWAYEWMLMDFCLGVSLGEVWEEMAWAERTVWITKVVTTLVKLKGLQTYPAAGSFADDEGISITSERDFGRGPFLKWRDERTEDLREAKTRLQSVQADSRVQEQQIQQLISVVNEVLQELSAPVYGEHPIVFTHRDVAPKNVLIDRTAQTITALLDWEWSGAGFLEDDIAEMDYPLTGSDTSNESFTDARGVPYSEQSEFVLNLWRALLPRQLSTHLKDYRQRALMSELCLMIKRRVEENHTAVNDITQRWRQFSSQYVNKNS